VSKRSGFYPCPVVDTAGSKVVSQAGGLLLTETVRAVGLDRAMAAALGVSAENPVTVSEQHLPGGRPRHHRRDASQHDRPLWPLDSSI
jgi:hypothetical protein